MLDFQDVEEDLIDYCKKYFDIYLVQRDLEGIKNIISDSMTGFGTGKDEDVNNKEDAVSIYSRDIKEAPNKIKYTITNMSAVALAENYGFTFGKLDINTFILDQQIKFNNLRFSIFLKKEKKKWEIVHLHMSFPSAEHGENESYPVKELEERNKILQRRVEEKTRELKKALKETKKLAITDKLTGLYNRFEIDNKLEYEIERAQRYEINFSVLLMDIDNFKVVNDNYGHQIGDQCLVKMVKLIKKNIRETDIFGRWGGDEFIIISPETYLKGAVSLANNIRAKVKNCNFDVNNLLTISIGVTSYSKGDNNKDIIKKADENLYKAKENGRNIVNAINN